MLRRLYSLRSDPISSHIHLHNPSIELHNWQCRSLKYFYDQKTGKSMKITYLPRRLLVGIAYANEAFQSLTRRRVCCMLLSVCDIDDLDWISGDWRAGTAHPCYGYPCEMLILFFFCKSKTTSGLRAFIHGRRGVAADRVTVTTFDLMPTQQSRQ